MKEEFAIQVTSGDETVCLCTCDDGFVACVFWHRIVALIWHFFFLAVRYTVCVVAVIMCCAVAPVALS
jgi:hypothetical protein